MTKSAPKLPIPPTTPEAPRMLVFSVLDQGSNTFQVPLFFTHVAIALRAFKLMCGNPESVLSKIPADFSFYQIGTYDERSGKMTSLPTPEFLVRASEMVEQLRKEALVA